MNDQAKVVRVRVCVRVKQNKVVSMAAHRRTKGRVAGDEADRGPEPGCGDLCMLLKARQLAEERDYKTGYRLRSHSSLGNKASRHLLFTGELRMG